MWSLVMDKLLACSHDHTTFPITPRKGWGDIHQTYVSCLDCGKELAYDWRSMRVGEPLRRDVPLSTAGVGLSGSLAQNVHHTLPQHVR